MRAFAGALHERLSVGKHARTDSPVGPDVGAISSISNATQIRDRPMDVFIKDQFKHGKMPAPVAAEGVQAAQKLAEGNAPPETKTKIR